ncbi:tRNA (N(6)-L-threonylcarbamoyladenosine(37)-C(2))-methylthiotransferase MtaB [Gehongia tenuis]|uniref:Threonylcarbamoyladenosine tRNA methylthiotransferase MtaB n=1 Tax=Gehongia tenuis TaxID=2763655 RepID=A0A926D3Z7_9FIRM|nr:tRNA (N(6)-L-threonylcarbamoyladenosine(37)-C(2))-methylthiotransferase MtaB [Gehongia tenuis]MBC8530908.1 tRNA (N(6)-L-threonylcarbamoyladenosine(37)-C(2))-methylthiotransferase MtaB [Gehongia tenuis]
MKVAFTTLGCKVNQYDTEAMLELFVKAGYEVAAFDEPADVYVINTCTVTAQGDRKSRQMVRRAKRINPKSLVVVAGCYAQTAPQEVMAVDGVDLVLGTENRGRVVEWVEEALRERTPMSRVRAFERGEAFEDLSIASHEGFSRAVLKIQEGCENYCTYCIIPFARGPVRSRPIPSIREEARRLAEAGYREVVLTGIHLTSYGRDTGGTLMDAIRAVHDVEGLQRIRLGSLEPLMISEDFVNSLKELPKVCPHFHLSMQSGSAAVLKRMNRRYTPEEYAGAAELLRAFDPLVALSTDVLTGFPMESEAEFDETCAFVERMAFSRIHVFPFSARQGTAAAKMKGQLDKKTKEARAAKLIRLGECLEREYAGKLLGTRQTVVLEEDLGNDRFSGCTPQYVKTEVQLAGGRSGQLLDVLITGAAGAVLEGTPLTKIAGAAKI